MPGSFPLTCCQPCCRKQQDFFFFPSLMLFACWRTLWSRVLAAVVSAGVQIYLGYVGFSEFEFILWISRPQKSIFILFFYFWQKLYTVYHTAILIWIPYPTSLPTRTFHLSIAPLTDVRPQVIVTSFAFAWLVGLTVPVCWLAVYPPSPEKMSP